jgi:thymidylate synthase (FAD)
MKIIQQSYEIEYITPDPLQVIENAARTCYKSENLIKSENTEAFIRKILDSEHLSVIEHCYMRVRFITERGVTHELVRHRLFSFSQESTRYCNYSKDKFGNELTFILPVRFKEFYKKINVQDNNMSSKFYNWYDSCVEAENRYFNALKLGDSPQEARDILPHSIKTEIIVTGNFREWLHFFKLRTTSKAHPQIRELAANLLNEVKTKVPIIFERM